MENHFHLLIQTPRPNLSEFMRHFNVSYTALYNGRHRRSGHLYQGRYHAFVVEKDSYLLEVSRYLHLNPVRVRSAAGKSASEKLLLLSRYRWSSHKGYVSPSCRQSFVDYSELLDYFGGDTAKGRKQYAEFVAEGMEAGLPSPLKDAVGNLILGGENFVENIKARFLSDDQEGREQPSIRAVAQTIDAESLISIVARVLKTPAAELLRRGRMTAERGMLMEALHRVCGLSQPEIGDLMGGLDYSTVSVNRKEFLLRMAKDKRLRGVFEKILREANR
jgi:hypothetical protein